MTDELFESLLHESEGEALDFKRDQYPFAGATHEQKGELIKDILAMANAWRRTTAYILIGVDEVPGGMSKVVGITHHLAESSLQQLVNSKTNRPVNFAYEAFEYKGQRVALIAVPVQARPFYVKSDYGKLKARDVYIRRGSSTGIAEPDEIAKMGAATALDVSQPILELHFADTSNRVVLGNPLERESKILEFAEREEIPSYGSGPLAGLSNQNFYREFAEYLEEALLFHEFGFVLINSGGTIASHARIELEIPKDSGLRFANFVKEAPTKSFMYAFNPRIASVGYPQLTVEDCGENWYISAGFGSVQPKAKSWTGQIYVGSSTESIQTQMKAHIFADELSTPAETTLEFKIIATRATAQVKINDLIKFADENK